MEVVRVEVSATIPSPPDAVWDVVSVFASQAKETTQMVMPGHCIWLANLMIPETVRFHLQLPGLAQRLLNTFYRHLQTLKFSVLDF